MALPCPICAPFCPKPNAHRRHAGAAGRGHRLAARQKCLTALRGRRAAFPRRVLRPLLVVHGLEEAESLRPLLRQLWRVLAPEGRSAVVAPNRASLWAQVERSPFGHGRPFSRSELDAIAAGRAVRARALAARALCAALRRRR